ncbi:MAG: hypothetical protein V7K55_19695 [Nostoc sp.]
MRANFEQSVLQQAPHADEAYKSLAYYHLYRGDWAQGVGVDEWSICTNCY